MPIVTDPHEFNQEDLYVDLRPIFEHPLFLKIEGFNFASSIKLKAAAEMLRSAERDGTLTHDSIIVESSSGNLGVALSMLTANGGYGFVCVTDSRCNPATMRLMEVFGADVHVVTEPAADGGGLLGARLEHVRGLCASDDRYLWLNQYANPANPRAHYRTTAPAIAQRFPDLDVLFVGAGTCGTLMGCASYMREWHPQVRIVAIDTVGSVLFGGPPGRRLIPGLGTGVRLPRLDESYIDDLVMVPEVDTIRTCRRMAEHGFLFGGSTGTVVSGALEWLSRNDTEHELTTVAISPDLGEHYLETVYTDEWVLEHYGADALVHDEPEPELEPDREHVGDPIAAQA